MTIRSNVKEEKNISSLLFVFLFLEDVVELHLVISRSLHPFFFLTRLPEYFIS